MDVVVGSNKLIVSFSVDGVVDTGWFGSGHAQPIHCVNNIVSSALLWRWWCHKETLWVLVRPHKSCENCLGKLWQGLPHLIAGAKREVTFTGAHERNPCETGVAVESVCH